MKAAIPILRIFDEAKAREFYAGFLGFHIDWEHRFAEGLPLYMQVSYGGCMLHLSEHHGDACPGAAIRVEVPGLDAYIDGLRAKAYRYAMPGQPVTAPWGLREITLSDPFANRITFYCEADAASAPV